MSVLTPLLSHDIVEGAFACGVPGFSLCGCPEVPGPPDFSGRNSHGWGKTRHRLMLQSLDGRAVATLLYEDGTLPEALSVALNLRRGGDPTGIPRGIRLSIRAQAHVVRRLRSPVELTKSPLLNGALSGIVAGTSWDADDMVRGATVQGVLDDGLLRARFRTWFEEWERAHPAESTPLFLEDEDRDHAVSVWRTPDGECQAFSDGKGASGETYPEAVKHLFQMLYPEPA